MRANSYIHGRHEFRVVGVCIVAHTIGGAEHYVYTGGLVPGDTLPSQIEALLEAGLIAEIGGAS